MQIYDNVLDTIGNTPLIRLNSVGSEFPVSFFGKVEFYNPGGSSKDRIALAMIQEAEKSGQLKPGGTIIEATAGNTGAGLALVAAQKGYRCIFVLPDKMSDEKINLLKAYGAEVVITPTSVAPDSPESYNGVADRLAREIPGAYRPSQFTNPHNPEIHYLTTGPEIWDAMDGQVDVFVAGMGTGGTISGVGKYLKEKNPAIQIIGADPVGSILSGDSPKSYKVEGIGEDFIPATFNRQVVDDMIRVSDTESFQTARRIARKEGLLVGGSGGTAMAAALKYAMRLQEHKNIVVFFPDTGRNYLTKIFNDEWMRLNGFDEAAPAVVKLKDILAAKKAHQPLLSIQEDQRAADAVEMLKTYEVSQLPVINQQQRIVGSVNEVTLIRLLSDGLPLDSTRVGDMMGPPLPQLELEAQLAEAYRILLSGHSGIVVSDGNQPIGFLSRIDLVNYWSAKQHVVR